jgi:hypothetical protein
MQMDEVTDRLAIIDAITRLFVYTDHAWWDDLVEGVLTGTAISTVASANSRAREHPPGWSAHHRAAWGLERRVGAEGGAVPR